MKRLCLLLCMATIVGCGGGGDGGPPTITSVLINGDSMVVLNGTRQLTATAMAGSVPLSSGVTFLWSSSDTTRGRVSGTGLVTGVRLGTTSITALAVLNGTPTSVSSSPHAVRTRIGSIVFTPAAPSFASLHDTVIVSADARDALNAPVTGVTFAWQSRSAGVASAADSGAHSAIVTALTNGTARIVATGDGVSDSLTATVQQVAVGLSISPDTTTFTRIGATLTPVVTAADARGNAVTAIGWSSQNTAAATVNPTTGLITSVTEGSSLVIGTSGALSDTIHVGVALVYKTVDVATSGALPAPIDSGVIHRLNGTLQLGFIVRDSGNVIVTNPQGIAWSFKHPGTVGTIGSTTGLITGNANTGRDTVVLVARTARDSVPVIVRQVPATIAVTPASPASLNFVGDTQRFAAEPRDSGGAAIAGQTIAWSTNNAILGIDVAGLATAAQRTSAAGVTVKVRAAAAGITDSSVSIVVKQVPASTTLNPNAFGTLTAFGRTAQASCVVLDSADDTIPNHACTWTALTAGIVTFSPATAQTTTVTAVGNGNTTIRAQAATSLFGFNSITVDQIPKTVRISPANFGTPDVTMKTNQTAPFFAAVLDSLDHPALEDSVTWSTNNAAITNVAATATLDSTVITTFALTGAATITATAGPASATRVVSVSASPLSLATDVQTIFNTSCINCHPSAAGISLTAGSSYASIVNQNASEVPAMKRVRPFMPDSSYLVHKIQGTQNTVGGTGVRMPLGCSGNGCLSNATINIIRNWILQGAANN